MKDLMRKAHQMTREIKVEFPNVDYKAQLGICMSYLLNEKGENEMIELQGTEKQVAWANDIREKTFENIKIAVEKIEEIQATRKKRSRVYDRRIDKLNILLEELKNEKSAKVFIEEYKSKEVVDFMNI